MLEHNQQPDAENQVHQEGEQAQHQGGAVVPRCEHGAPYGLFANRVTLPSCKECLAEELDAEDEYELVVEDFSDEELINVIRLYIGEHEVQARVLLRELASRFEEISEFVPPRKHSQRYLLRQGLEDRALAALERFQFDVQNWRSIWAALGFGVDVRVQMYRGDAPWAEAALDRTWLSKFGGGKSDGATHPEDKADVGAVAAKHGQMESSRVAELSRLRESASRLSDLRLILESRVDAADASPRESALLSELTDRLEALNRRGVVFVHSHHSCPCGKAHEQQERRSRPAQRDQRRSANSARKVR